ncbi:TonB-dependent receptor [Massilia endophytica]|uniref:TonB-dependent receptor n=1 Tax=Massilia endophytica TaxID=2899220 RepID=UPI001E52B527|nr:TonB-dependent receptor [Massilia endophytica]UGQ48716.1 TonB-dependent receptor [Massilia endophytica]
MSMYEKKPLAVAVSLALMTLAAQNALAQQAPAADSATQVVEVTGIRASMAKSLSVKKNSSANVEVITAEDVGKMPDKNLADSLQRLTGVAVRTDYDEAEKVAMRGTNPDHTLIIFNGHAVAGGDWYISDQLSSSRSTSLSLMPSNVLNQAIVYKTSQANIQDGGLAGTINVTTRKPLAQKERLSGVVNLGGVYADLPGKATHDVNASVNWKNEANTFGIIVQGFAEKRMVRRDSVSRFAYPPNSGWDVINTATMKGITDESLAGTGLKAADLNGVRIPGSMSMEYVQGERDRKGGMFSAQFKPNKDLDMTMTGFHSSMKAPNYGRLNAGAIISMLQGKQSGQGPYAGAPTSVNGKQVFAQIKNPVIVTEKTMFGHELRVLKSADIVYPDGTPPQYIGETEGAYRDGALAKSSFLDLDAKYRVNQDLTIKGLFSTTRGEGKTDLDQGLTYTRFGTGVSYALGGLKDAPMVKYYGTGPNMYKPQGADGTGFVLTGRNAANARTVDRENSLNLDAEYSLDRGMLKSLESGVRFSEHKRSLVRRFPQLRYADLAPNAPTSGFIPWPSDFGNGLDGPAGWDNTSWTITPEALKAYYEANRTVTSSDWERRAGLEIDMRERQSAGYIMANLEADRLSGNIGLRLVRTEVDAMIPYPIPAGICTRSRPGEPIIPCPGYPDAITWVHEGTGSFQDRTFNPKAGSFFYKKENKHHYTNVLPSLNLRYELQDDMITRFGLSRTIGRQNYNLFAVGYSSATCGEAGCTIIGPNPNISPQTSNNADLSWAWYFAPRSLVSVNLYYSKIKGYPKTGIAGAATIEYIDPRDSQLKTFNVLTSSQQGAHVGGIELAYEQPIGKTGFGFTSNVSRAKTKVDDGLPMVGASEWAANLGGYFENDKFSARLVANYRSEYVNSSTAPTPNAASQGKAVINGVTMPVAPTMAAPVTTLAFNASYNITPTLILSFDATNLTNAKRAYYRYSEEEQQKLDVSGRQYYLNLKYKF